MTSPSGAAARYAHELVPHLPEDEVYGARWATRYHVARGAGLLWGWYRRSPRAMPDDTAAFRMDMVWLQHALAEAELGLLSYALLTEQPNPHEWVRLRMGADVVGEWLWEAGEVLGLDMDGLRPYEMPDGAA